MIPQTWHYPAVQVSTVLILPENLGVHMKPLSKVELAYAAIKEDLLSGRLAQGSALRLEMLQTVYGHGTTPLREALGRLESEGLVEQLQHRGFFATSVSSADFDDLLYTRTVLERALVLRAIERGDDAWEGRVITAHHFLAKTRVDISCPDERMDQWQERHVEFHLAIASGSGATRLLADYRRAFEHIRRHQVSLAQMLPMGNQSERREPTAREIAELERRMAISEHTRLMEAVLSRDVPRTLDVLAAHLQLMPLHLGDATPAATA
jgi:DNA-binding GntR family transcriptional regulator